MTMYKSALTIFVTLLGVSIFCQIATAQVAIEDALSTDLNFRGQGRAGLCYAFAEEQLLKDYTCTNNCQTNASEWKFSIFDIARAHQMSWKKKYGEIKNDPSRDLFANGSNEVFPFAETNVGAVRASKCTLEQEIFFLNRSKITNPSRFAMADYLIDFYKRYKLGSLASLQIKSATLHSAWAILQELAVASDNEFDFLAKVINFTKCSDKIQIPSFHFQSKDLSETKEVVNLIKPLLNQGKSLYVGVCAEVLESESIGTAQCGRHAVVLKGIKKADDCVVGECKSEILVVDSAFFSKRPRNGDGSTWIPASIVIQSIVKSGQDILKIQEKSNQNSKKELHLHEDRMSKIAKDSATEMTNIVKKLVKESGNTNIQAATLSILDLIVRSYPESSSQAKMYIQVLNEVKLLTINTIEDIGIIAPIIEQVTLASLTTLSNNSSVFSANGIVWIDDN